MYKFTYHFKFPETGEPTVSYNFGLSKDKIEFVDLHKKEEENNEMLEWAKLDFNKCSHCPLNSEEHPYCPVAKNLFNVVNYFKDTRSFVKSMIFIETEDRSYAKNADVQTGLFSIFGLIMASSGCPHLNFFKPMARFHLPFANDEETFVRATSMWLLRQHIRKENGEDVKVDLTELLENYAKVEIVNKHILERISKLSQADADKNAIIILTNYSQLLTYEASTNFSSVKDLFSL
jgi:hypothetical protein